MYTFESLTDWDTDVAVIDDVEGELFDRERRPTQPLASVEVDMLDDLGAALGLTYEEEEELWLGTKEASRDSHRWELDPASAEDWGERRRR
jgi:hypothetical protein